MTGFASTRGREIPYLALEDYARFLGMAENALYGIVRVDDPATGCDDFYWDETDRYKMTRAIQQAERMLETHLGHPLKPVYFCDERYPFRGCDVKLRRGNVLSLGAKVETVIGLGVATGVAVQADEYTLTATVDFAECHEIVVYYPGQTRWEIKPSKVVISGTTVSITIPRSRLLKPEYLIDFKNDGDRPIYETASYFLETVDVYRRFADLAQAAMFVWYRKSCGCASNTACLHTTVNPGQVLTQAGTGVIVDSRLGLIKIEPATLNQTTGDLESESWTECHDPDSILISYLAGVHQDCDDNCPEVTDPEITRAIIALAHSNLPRPICGCDPVKMFYEMDAFSPKPDEGPTIFSPFGTTRGQNLAWGVVKRRAHGQGGLLA